MIYVIMLFGFILYGFWVGLQLLLFFIIWLCEPREIDYDRRARWHWFFLELSFIERFQYLFSCVKDYYQDKVDIYVENKRFNKFITLNQEYYDYTGNDFQHCVGDVWDGQERGYFEIRDKLLGNCMILGSSDRYNAASPVNIERERRSKVTWRPPKWK